MNATTNIDHLSEIDTQTLTELLRNAEDRYLDLVTKGYFGSILDNYRSMRAQYKAELDSRNA